MTPTAPGLHRLLAYACARWPTRVAVVHDDAAYTFADLEGRAAPLRAALRPVVAERLSRQRRPCIGLACGTHVDYLAGLMAILEVGGVVVPFSPDLPAPQLAFLAGDCDLAAIVANHRLPRRTVAAAGYCGPLVTPGSQPPDVPARPRSPEPQEPARPRPPEPQEPARPRSPEPQEPARPRSPAPQEAGSPRPPEPQETPAGDTLAMVLYTSGTTARPKGVCLSHGNLWSNLEAIIAYQHLETIRSTAVVLPLHYCYALVNQVLTSLRLGVTLHLCDGLLYPGQVMATMAEREVEGICAVASGFRVLHECRQLDGQVTELPRVKVACSAGEHLSPAVRRAMRALFPQAVLYNNYGLTEASPRVAGIGSDDPRFDDDTVGRPIPGVTCTIRRADGTVAAPGERGELVVDGPNVMLGYLNCPDLTRDHQTAHGLRTNDWASMDEAGYITIHGRRDELVNTGGELVSPREVEEVLQRAPGVARAVAAGLPDEHLGSRLVAFVEPVPGTTLTRDALVAHCRGELSPFKIPRAFYLVPRLPRSDQTHAVREALTSDPRSVRQSL